MGLPEDVSTILAIVTAMQTQVNGLQADIDAINADVAQVKADAALLKADVGSVKSDAVLLKDDVGLVKQKITGTIVPEVGGVKSTVSRLSSAVSHRLVRKR